MLHHRPLRHLAQVIHLRTRRTPATATPVVTTWADFSQAVYDDDRLVPEPGSNVVPIGLPARRSDSFEIASVRISEERRVRRVR